MNKSITITSIDEVGGRVLVDAPDVADETTIAVYTEPGAPAWGKGKAVSGQAMIVGRPLPATYSLRVVAYPVRHKVTPAAPAEPIKPVTTEAPEK